MRKLVEKLALQAGSLLLKKMGQPRQLTEKGVKDLVTDADLAAEKLLLKGIASSRFAAPVLSEEKGGKWKDEDTFWIIDPLDGTLNYAIGNPLFGVNVAYVEKGVPKAGASYLPYLGEIFYAEKGKGAFLNGKRIACPKKPLDKSVVFLAISYRNEALLEKGITLERKLMHSAYRLRDPGSMALGIAYVACGRYGACLNNTATPWDITAGCLMVEEAGGKVSDFSGKKWNPFIKTMCASNSQNHAELLKILR